MIPKIIQRQHVIQAINDIRVGGVPKQREATKFNLIHEGRLYPPKFTLSLAAKHATGEELAAAEFSGGDEANSYLTDLGFVVQPKRDDWSWKECYFAVWAYDQLDLDPTYVKVALYREVSELIGRTAKSIEFKLQNVSSFDFRPREEKPIAEAKNAQALLGEVFNWYWADRLHGRLRYDMFREEFQFNLESTIESKSPIPQNLPEIIIEEGAATASPSFRRKRSQKLLDEGRKHFRNKDKEGKLRCHACGFATPVGLEKEIIHLHHTEPIYESADTGRSQYLKDALAQLVPLCPTCHALAHTSRPPLSVIAIQTLFPA